jgi:hypothetical protein
VPLLREGWLSSRADERASGRSEATLCDAVRRVIVRCTPRLPYPIDSSISLLFRLLLRYLRVALDETVFLAGRLMHLTGPGGQG